MLTSENIRCHEQGSRAPSSASAFRTSRLLDFVGERELVAQAGHEVEDWPLVASKEIADNSIDAAEEHDIAPVIEITV